MKTLRLCVLVSMSLYFSISCIAFFAIAALMLHDLFTKPGINMMRSLLLLVPELGMASVFGLATCAMVMGWKTRNRWGIAGSLLSLCAPLPVLYWGTSLFWHYLLGCLWPSWLFGTGGLVFFSKAGTPHSLSHGLKMNLERVVEAQDEMDPSRRYE